MQKIDISEIPGIRLFPSNKFFDDRGYFNKVIDRKSLVIEGLNLEFDSIAISSNNHAGTIRGLHFQSKPFAEEKIISCLSGKIFDVAVDLRIESPTFSQWGSITLSADEPRSILLPKGVAHGFQTLENNCVLLYALSAPYEPGSSHTLNYADPDLDIRWPLVVTNISKKDLSGINLGSAVDISRES